MLTRYPNKLGNAPTLSKNFFLIAFLTIHLAQCLQFNCQPKLLLMEYSKIQFRSLGMFLSILEKDSLRQFARWMLYKSFNFYQYYKPFPNRKGLLVQFIETGIMGPVISDIVTLSSLVADSGIQILFEHPHVMQKLRLTDSPIKFGQLSVEGKRRFITFITQKKYRRVYSEIFYSYELVEEHSSSTIIDLENWEFFDFICVHETKLSFSNLAPLIRILKPLAKRNDFALFRLATLRLKAHRKSLTDITKDEFFDDLYEKGTDWQKTILELGDRLLEFYTPFGIDFYHSPNTLRQYLRQTSEKEIRKTYYYFKDLLRKKNEACPAFLLELLVTTIVISTEQVAGELLEDLVKSYPPTKLSPSHLYRALEFFPSVAKRFRKVRKTLGPKWDRVSMDGTYRYYFPKLAFTNQEILDAWRCDFFYYRTPNYDTIKRFFDVKEVEGAFKFVDGQYRFFCNETYNNELTREFIKAGFTLTAFGSDDFINGMPKALRSLVINALDKEANPILSQKINLEECLVDVCIDIPPLNFLHLDEIIKNFKEAIEKYMFPLQVFFFD